MVTLAALVFADLIAYQKSFSAQLSWVKINSGKAAQLFPKATITHDTSGIYVCEYFAMNRDIQKLLGVLNGTSCRVGEESVQVTGLSKKAAETALANLKRQDVLKAGHFVIRGRLLDSAGQPLSKATIDLNGDFMFVNCFHTRQDGTFILAFNDIDPNFRGTGSYSFKIRTFDESKSWQSSSFRLKANEPEQVVIITVR